MSEPLRIALVGLGTVGGGVIRLMEANADLITRRAGRPIVITTVSARNRHKDRGFDVSRYAWEDDMVILGERPDVDVVVELVGGADGPALALARTTFEAGKALVTANKAMIAHHGEEYTEKWLDGLKANLARRPAGGDREGVRDVQAGLCDIAVGNTYYMAAMLKNPDQKAWANAVRIIFPNAADRGTHVNVSGMAMTANAPNKDNALRLMEFLASPEAQRLYAEANGEYPVVEGVPTSPVVESWGPLKSDPLPLTEIAALRKKASELVDRVQFDQGPSN